MKNICKKLITVMLIVVIILNFSFFQNVSMAADTLSGAIADLLGTFVGILTWLIRLPAIGIAFSANVLTAQIAYMNGATESGVSTAVITPYEIFFNKVQLFDINFFDFSGLNTDDAVYIIRTQVAKWFYIMRLLAVSGLLLILLYVGIRMALTSIAEDKAKYKQMLIDWATSLVLVFMLQYIIIFTININNAIVDAIAGAANGTSTYTSDEISKVIRDIALNGLGITTSSLSSTVVYCLIVWQTLGFVIAYLNRTIKIAFLIIISPLISITYAVDKMGDGKSQALNAWLKEFVFTILLQPFHCVIYISLVSMAFELLHTGGAADLAAGVLAILCVKFVKTAEQLVRKIFNFQDDGKGTTLDAGAAVAAGALKKSKEIGQTARKAVNFAKDAKITDKLKKDTTKIGAAVKALRKTKEEKQNEKNGGEKVAYSERVQRRKAAMERKSEERKESRENKKAWKMYQKHKGEYTSDDKKNISNTARQIQSENPGMTYQEAMKKARIKVSKEKIASGAYKSKVVRGVKGFVKGVNSLETVKYLKNTAIPAGFGLFVGSASFESNNAIEAIMSGVAAKNAASEFMKNSTATLSENVLEQTMAQGIYGGTETAEKIMQVKVEGDGGDLNADKFNKLVEKLEEAVGKAKAKDIKHLIDSKFQERQYNFDIESLVKKSLGTSTVDPSTLSIAQNMKNFRHDQIIYAQLNEGKNVNISAESIAEKAASDVDVAFDEKEFIENAKTTIVSKETVKTIKHREGYDFSHIESKLNDEIDDVRRQIRRLQDMMTTAGTQTQRDGIQKNIEELTLSENMLKENVRNVQEFARKLDEGETF